MCPPKGRVYLVLYILENAAKKGEKEGTLTTEREVAGGRIPLEVNHPDIKDPI
jgi:hypothetical protein